MSRIGWLISRLDEVDSTNRQARIWAKEGGPHGAVLVAREQTAGRGRRGNTWASACGTGLWLSVLLRPSLDRAEYPMLTFAAALAAADACEAIGRCETQIKWPNDLLLKRRKIAGILLELEGDAVILGIGINANQRAEDFPSDLREKAGSIAMLTGLHIELLDLERALLEQIEARIAQRDFMQEYKRRCITIGQAVRVLETGQDYEGIAEDIDAIGALLVRDSQGASHRVLAGDVSIRGIDGYV